MSETNATGLFYRRCHPHFASLVPRDSGGRPTMALRSIAHLPGRIDSEEFQRYFLYLLEQVRRNRKAFPSVAVRKEYRVVWFARWEWEVGGGALHYGRYALLATRKGCALCGRCSSLLLFTAWVFTTVGVGGGLLHAGVNRCLLCGDIIVWKLTAKARSANLAVHPPHPPPF